MPRTSKAGLLLAVVLGCGCGQEPDGATSGVLRVAIETAPARLDPRLAFDQASSRACQLLHAGLVGRDERLAVVPDVAERWQVSEDGRTYRFFIRPGIRFHDGRPLTSADVVRTLESILDPSPDNPHAGRRGDLGNVIAIEAPSPFEVVIALREPDAPFLSNLVPIGILPDGRGPGPGELPVGAGPFRLVRHVAGTELRFESHPDYHLGEVELAGLVLRVLPDAAARVSALRAGEVDLIINDLPPDLLEGLLRDPALDLVRRPGVNLAYLAFNMQDPLLADARVRRAIAHAIDRESLVRFLLRGRGRPARSLLPEEHWAFPDDLPDLAFDPALAARLLDAAGHGVPPGGGPRLRLELKTSNAESARRQAEVLRSALQAVGIELATRSFEWGTYYEDLRAGRFQLTTGRWVGIDDPDVFRLRFHSRQRPEDGGLNRGRYADAGVDALIDAGRRALTVEERALIYARLQHELAADLPYVNLYHVDNVAVMRRGLSGVVLNPAADFHLLWKATWRAPGEPGSPGS